MTAEWDALMACVTTDELVACIESGLRRRGAGFEDIDERIAAELGVPIGAWSGYLAVKRAADRYQTDRAPSSPGGSRQIRRNGGQRK